MFRGIIAAIWDMESLGEIGPDVVFLLKSDILNLKFHLKILKDKGKTVFVDVDFVSGLGEGEEAVLFVKKAGADGIITIKPKTTLLRRKTISLLFSDSSHSTPKQLKRESSRSSPLEWMWWRSFRGLLLRRWQRKYPAGPSSPPGLLKQRKRQEKYSST
ncbi:Glycerol uptake operon antiterminator-related protein [Thermotoga neapolitana DSM 4359]|uniref:Glycerol uptake operon antiterminator-related protein n=1 Tax=Thermotoga neapolitana (strain ATCC 49049 / DSM 4359 / NBRC 107923 / NS-E) TaxID=309803 RepID=B9K8F1_THENN|nr:Glycerol uptake operon antiterminator-related protein [Thermotoga neapolitana DSM 4359]